MSEYIFKVGHAVEIELSHSYELWLFQYPTHIKLQSPDDWLTYYIIDKKREQIDCHIHFHISDGKAISPYRATFGSFQCKSSLNGSVFFDFVQYVLSSLRERGVSTVVIKNPPDGYCSGYSAIHHTILFNLGFQVQSSEIASLLTIKHVYEEGLNTWEKRKLKQCRKADLKFSVVPANRLKDIYSFIRGCRERKKYHLSIEWETLERLANTFPTKIFLFEVCQLSELIAASICIDIGNGVLYNFHSAHHERFDHLSPVVFLLEGIYNFAMERQYHLLDLGTSALDNKPNFSLLDFKLGLGASASMKLTLSKTL